MPINRSRHNSIFNNQFETKSNVKKKLFKKENEINQKQNNKEKQCGSKFFQKLIDRGLSKRIRQQNRTNKIQSNNDLNKNTSLAAFSQQNNKITSTTNTLQKQTLSEKHSFS